MLSAILIVILGLIALLTRRYFARRILPISIRPVIVIVAAILLVVSAIFVVYQLNDIHNSLSRRNWPHTTGNIIASQLTGGELFRPRIMYTYQVEGRNYRDSSHLHAPGFGGKGQRRDAGMHILASYPSGSSVIVHYNPDNPAESVVLASVRWDEYAKLGFYLSLFFIAAIIVIPCPRQRSATEIT